MMEDVNGALPANFIFVQHWPILEYAGISTILRCEAEYEAALARVEALIDADAGSPQEAELIMLAMLVEQFEREHYPIARPDPADAMLFRQDQQHAQTVSAHHGTM